jgi:anti-sigma B factor antagonist
MSLTVQARAETYRSGTVVILALTGEADGRSAVELDGHIARAVGEHAEDLRELRFDLNALTYLSSAGLRSLVVAHQRLGRGVRIVLTGASEEVAETIRLTGFDRSAVVEESLWR